MTAKRFTITQDFEEHHRQIRDNGKIIMGCFLEPQAEPIVKLLNELSEENEQLKEALKELKEIGDYQADRIQELSDENEQLKQQLAHHTRMHEWFRNEAYLLQNKLDNREDEIRRLKGDVE